MEGTGSVDSWAWMWGGATGLGVREMESWGERGREREIGLGVLS